MRILAVQLKRIGDLILTTPALAALREKVPGCNITLATADSAGDLLDAIPSIDEGLVFTRSNVNLGAWRRVIFRHYDACLDFTGNDRSALITRLSGARLRATMNRDKHSRLRARAYTEFIESPVQERHTVDWNCDLLTALDLHGTPPPIRLSPPQRAFEEATRLREQQNFTGEFAIVHAGTAREEKYWEPIRWAAVVDHLHSRGLRVVLTGGVSDFEKAHLALIQSSAKSPAVDLSGKLSLTTLAALVSQARLVASCDTSVVHLAAAFEKPQVVLYGPINPFHWRPRHGKAIVISATQPDAPLTEFAPKIPRATMDKIPVQTVITAVDQALAGE